MSRAASSAGEAKRSGEFRGQLRVMAVDGLTVLRSLQQWIKHCDQPLSGSGVNRPRLIKILLRNMPDRREGGRMRGTVDETIQTPKAVKDRFAQALQCGLIVQIHRNQDTSAAFFTNRIIKLFQAPNSPRYRDNGRVWIRQSAGGGKTQTPRGTGHKCNIAHRSHF